MVTHLTTKKTLSQTICPPTPLPPTTTDVYGVNELVLGVRTYETEELGSCTHCSKLVDDAETVTCQLQVRKIDVEVIISVPACVECDALTIYIYIFLLQIMLGDNLQVR